MPAIATDKTTTLTVGFTFTAERLVCGAAPLETNTGALLLLLGGGSAGWMSWSSGGGGGGPGSVG